MRHQPGDGLAHDVSLEVEAFHRYESLPQACCADNVGLPLKSQAPRGLYSCIWDLELVVGWQGCKEVDQGERVIQVPQSINKSWIPAMSKTPELQKHLYRAALQEINHQRSLNLILFRA